MSQTITSPAPRYRQSLWALLLANRLATLGLTLLVIAVAAALAAPLLPIPDPDATDLLNRLLPPFSPGHWLGTDPLGRDMLSRLLWGTRVSLAVGICATLLAALLGTLIGLVAGYAGGKTDSLLMRLIDMLMAFPYILLALVIVAVLGPGLLNALYAIAVVNIPFFARNIRGLTVGLRQRDFIQAARLSGKNHLQILLTEVLPNVMPVVVVTMSTTVGWMILETAGLSFLGLGTQPPNADLGSMLGQGRAQMFSAPHVSVVPGLMIFLLVMSFNLLGDGIRDLLDPRLKSGILLRARAVTTVTRSAVPPAVKGSDALLEVDTCLPLGPIGGLHVHLLEGAHGGIRFVRGKFSDHGEIVDAAQGGHAHLRKRGPQGAFDRERITQRDAGESTRRSKLREFLRASS